MKHVFARLKRIQKNHLCNNGKRFSHLIQVAFSPPAAYPMERFQHFHVIRALFDTLNFANSTRQRGRILSVTPVKMPRARPMKQRRAKTAKTLCSTNRLLPASYIIFDIFYKNKCLKIWKQRSVVLVLHPHSRQTFYYILRKTRKRKSFKNFRKRVA